MDRALMGGHTPTLLLAAALGAACGDPADPTPETERVIVAAGDQGRLPVVNWPEGSIVARPGPFPEFHDGYILSPDRETLYFTAVSTGTERVLMGISTRSFALTSQVSLSELENRSQVPGLALDGNSSLAFSPDGSKLLLADASLDGTTGIAILEVASLTPVGFLGPLSVRPYGIRMTPSTTAAPAGRIFAIGTRTPGSVPRADSLYLLDPATSTVLEAVAIAPPASDGSGSLFEMQPNPAGEIVYLLGADLLYAYDVQSRTVLASAGAPRLGSIGVSGDGAAVYVTDPGDRRNTPGTGIVLAFSATLDVHAPIDLRAESVGGVFPPTEGITAGLDGAFLYIVSGTGPRGPLFGPQPRRVFVVDAVSRSVVGRIPLGDYGGGPIFVVR